MYNLIELSPQIFSEEKIVINVFFSILKTNHKKSDATFFIFYIDLLIWDSSSLSSTLRSIITN